MSTAESILQSRLRVSAVLILLGLVVEGVSLTRIHPLAFLSFMFVGGGLLIGGIATYLFSIVSAGQSSAETDSR